MSRLFRISLLLAIFFGLEKLLGFVRLLVIARQFSDMPELLDAFNTANNLPDLIFALISGGALAIAFIPLLSETLQKEGRERTWNLFSQVANLVFLVTAGLSILIAIFAQPLVAWRLGIAPGFGPEQQALVASLMRLNLIATLIFSISGLVIAGLQANQHFLLPAIAPMMYDIGTLFGVFVLAPETGYALGPLQLPAFGMGIYGLVYGTILGAALFLLVQVPGLVRYHFRWAAQINVQDPRVRQVVNMMGPRVITVFFIQLVFLAQDNFASRLPDGAVTALVYGWLMMQVPETLIGTAIGTALLPTLSEQIARGERDQFAHSLQRTIQVILAITLPLAVLIGLVIRPVANIFGFEPAITEMIVWAARMYLLGLMAHSLLEVAVRAFYAQKDARTPLVAAGLMLVCFVGFGAVLFRPLGAGGIALANSLAFSIEAGLLLWLVNRQHPGVLRLGPAAVRIGGGTILGALAAYVLSSGIVPPIALLSGSGMIGAVLVASGALALGVMVVLPFIWQEVKLLVRL